MIAVLVLCAAHASVAQAAEPVELLRVFTKGEKASYSVKSSLSIEARSAGLKTFLPQDVDLSYDFSTEVLAVKADGICEMRYRRPTMTEVQGETYDRPARTHVEKVNILATLTLSPINEILNSKDESPKKPGDKTFADATTPSRADQEVNLEQFIGELQRLALFLGSLDSSLDFSPKLPYDAVNPGDTWKRTVGYTPQKLSGKEKSAVQRLDYVYTYRGITKSSGKDVHRVTADLNVDTDAAPFVNQLLGMKPEQSGLKSVKLQLKATIEFDLDVKTRQTLRADARSTGAIRIDVTDLPHEALMEQRLKGRTVMTLVSSR
jgi:hypothetical protein